MIAIELSLIHIGSWENNSFNCPSKENSFLEVIHEVQALTLEKVRSGGGLCKCRLWYKDENITMNKIMVDRWINTVNGSKRLQKTQDMFSNSNALKIKYGYKSIDEVYLNENALPIYPYDNYYIQLTGTHTKLFRNTLR